MELAVLLGLLAFVAVLISLAVLGGELSARLFIDLSHGEAGEREARLHERRSHDTGAAK